MFFKEISSRPICYQCPFKTLERCSDFTIYDCWHAAELVPNLKDDDMGYTNVIVQSDQGKQLLAQIADKYEIYQTDTMKAIDLDGIMVFGTAKPHEKRQDFYVGIDEQTMPEQIQNFIPVTIKDVLVERVKIIFYLLGIFQAVKKVLKR